MHASNLCVWAIYLSDPENAITNGISWIVLTLSIVKRSGSNTIESNSPKMTAIPSDFVRLPCNIPFKCYRMWRTQFFLLESSFSIWIIQESIVAKR